MEKSLETTFGSKETLHQSGQTRTPQTLYSGRINYDSTAISNRSFRQLDQNFYSKDIPFSLARFTSTRVSQSYIHIVQTLKILEANIDNEGNDELGSLKQAMRHYDWPK